jgi:putative glutamine amidotransferase
LTGQRPRIGITTYGPDRADLPAVSLPIVYVRAVECAGGLPLLLPACESGVELLDGLDALILSGGGDIDPAHHTTERHESVYGVSPARDAFELELARAALVRPELPLLGICRGAQILNVALGGDLELHLPDARPEGLAHRIPPLTPARHDVRLEPATPLAEIYGQLEFGVCSWHHQEVRRLGRGLRPIAWAPDGVVEALIYEDHPFALGVQWHPELQVEREPLQRRLFEALVERARAR